MRITVFTPTYNRGYIIKALYESLKRQTFKDFEWVVVDDGSSDNTLAIFQNEIIPDNHFFNIIYITTPNGGKHRAINEGVRHAHGDLFYIVDSDDYVTDDALEKIIEADTSIPVEDRISFAGICGLKGHSMTEIIGSTFDGDRYLDITVSERPKYNIRGDKSHAFYTDILKKYPFPEFEGENFLTEAVVFDKISNDGYTFRHFNNIIHICNYLPDGLTVSYKQRLESAPKGYALYLYQQYKFGTLNKKAAWFCFLQYFYSQKSKYTIFTIAKYLHQNQVYFCVRITYMRIREKLNYLVKKYFKLK